MDLEFRFARVGEYPRIARFLQEYWAPGHVYVRHPRLFDWTFRRDDLWGREGYSFALCESQGEIAGILGAIPFELNVRGRSGRGLWLANLMVQPAYRKGAAAVTLLEMFNDPAFDAVIAFRISEMAAPFYRAMKWCVTDDIDRHIAILAEPNRVIRFLQMASPDWNADEAADVAAFFSVQEVADRVDTSDAIPERWDDVVWPRLASSRIGAARNTRYLEWRYRRHPEFQYRFLSVGAGLAVWRLECVHMQTDRGLVSLDRFARLVEFLPASADNAESLLKAFLSAAGQEGAMAADYFGYHGAVQSLLDSCGMRRANQHPCGLRIPSRFQPLDGKVGAIPSALKLSPELLGQGGGRLSDWYWTKSDGDQDRPN